MSAPNCTCPHTPQLSSHYEEIHRQTKKILSRALKTDEDVRMVKEKLNGTPCVNGICLAYVCRVEDYDARAGAPEDE